jgi:hypothetical protein
MEEGRVADAGQDRIVEKGDLETSEKEELRGTDTVRRTRTLERQVSQLTLERGDLETSENEELRGTDTVRRTRTLDGQVSQLSLDRGDLETSENEELRGTDTVRRTRTLERQVSLDKGDLETSGTEELRGTETVHRIRTLERLVSHNGYLETSEKEELRELKLYSEPGPLRDWLVLTSGKEELRGTETVRRTVPGPWRDRSV